MICAATKTLSTHEPHGDIMVLSHENDTENVHPYWYARIIGIFHAMVTQKDTNSRWSEPQKMEFLFVWWFGLDTAEPGGWKLKDYTKSGFLMATTPLNSDSLTQQT